MQNSARLQVENCRRS